RRRHTRSDRDWSSDVCSSDLEGTHWLLAVAVGAIMLSYALSLAAASEILKANVSSLDAGAAIVVFSLTSIVTVAAPIVVAVTVRSGERRVGKECIMWRLWCSG